MKFIKRFFDALASRPLPPGPLTAPKLETYTEPAQRQTKKPKEKRIKVALDECIGRSMTDKIRARGYDIVCRAGTAEPDDVWMKRALAYGALFIISPDLDIPSIIERENYPMIWIDFLFADQVDPLLNTKGRDEKREIWVQYVHDRIQAKLKFFTKKFGRNAENLYEESNRA